MEKGLWRRREQRARTLAAAAEALNRASGGPAAPFHLAFLSDAKRGPDPIETARALAPGTAIILRDYDDPKRAETARALAAIAAARGLVLLIGGDAALAGAVGADGVHWRSRDLASHHDHQDLIVSAACHSADELGRASAVGADVALLSPAFPTQSHPEAKGLGAAGFKRLAAAAALPVIALGGVDETNAGDLAGVNVAGFAAVGAFSVRASD